MHVTEECSLATSVLDRYSTSPNQHHYLHIRIRIKIEQVEKRWGYSCRPDQDMQIRICKQRPEKKGTASHFIRMRTAFIILN